MIDIEKYENNLWFIYMYLWYVTKLHIEGIWIIWSASVEFYPMTFDVMNCPHNLYDYFILQLRSVPKNRVKGFATKMGDIFSRLCLFLAKITNCAYKHVYRIKKNIHLHAKYFYVEYGDMYSAKPHLPSSYTSMHLSMMIGKLPPPLFVWQS
jgi:hypothetical protein